MLPWIETPSPSSALAGHSRPISRSPPAPGSRSPTSPRPPKIASVTSSLPATRRPPTGRSSSCFGNGAPLRRCRARPASLLCRGKREGRRTPPRLDCGNSARDPTLQLASSGCRGRIIERSNFDHGPAARRECNKVSATNVPCPPPASVNPRRYRSVPRSFNVQTGGHDDLDKHPKFPIWLLG